MKASVRGAIAVAVAFALTFVVAPGAHAQPVPPPEPDSPTLQEVFNPFVVGTFVDGGFGSQDEIFQALNPNDPFYQEPQLTGGEPPGTLLKSKPVDVMFTGFKPGNLDAYKLMYVTTGVDGEHTISTGILMIPVDGRDNATRPLIGYQMANDSVGPYCHPSTMWTGGDPIDGASWSALGPLAQMFGNGWAVMITDVGNDGDPDPHGVFAGKFAGHANLDGLRAAIALDDAGLSSSPPISLFGIAGGGVGAAFAAERQAAYAPELNVKSVVLEGIVINTRDFLRNTDGSVGSGFGFALLLGLEPWYPDMKVDEKLTPAGKAIADEYRNQCQTPAYFTMPFVPLSTLFNDGQSPADIPDFQRAFEDNQLGTQAPRAPVMITSCVADDSPMSLVTAQNARDLVAQYRAGGTQVIYEPTDCSLQKLFTDPYGWGTDLFGMQTVDWIEATLR
ncbi:MAG: lipase [Rhodococcus sp.]|nr:lipase [Rhodococcus sp. (in: high G+C Gram-positive bacteria)]